MSLEKALADVPAADMGPVCTVSAVISNLPESEAEALKNALNNELWRSTELSRVLQNEGIYLSAATLQRHRRGGCKCQRLGLT
jgi:hypothetical protein